MIKQIIDVVDRGIDVVEVFDTQEIVEVFDRVNEVIEVIEKLYLASIVPEPSFFSFLFNDGVDSGSLTYNDGINSGVLILS